MFSYPRTCLLRALRASSHILTCGAEASSGQFSVPVLPVVSPAITAPVAQRIFTEVAAAEVAAAQQKKNEAQPLAHYPEQAPG